MFNLHTQRQRGVSLIEMMISMVITTLLMLGVTGVYVTSKRGYNLQDGLARQQENARFSLDILIRDLRMAGYAAPVVPPVTIDPIVAASTSDGGGALSDTITLSYESATDCLNQPAPANIAVNRYFIDNNGNLVCQGNGSADIEVLAEGIDNMQVLYGVDTDSEPDGEANKYIKWSDVTVPERAQIVSVQIGLLASTTTEVAGATVAKTHQVLDQTVNSNDKRLRRYYVNTIVLRNRLQ